MKYFLGIDGGGTKSKAVLIDSNFVRVAECKSGPTNFLVIGTDKVCETLLNLINACVEKSNIPAKNIASIVLGTTGAGRISDANKLKKEFLQNAKKKQIDINSFIVVSDARIALEGAFSGEPGSILIAGTGSIMFGKDKNEKIYRVGGFGRYIGDDGSGFGIGRKGLIAVAKNLDGRGEDSLITQYVAEQFNIKTPDELITEVYNNNFEIPSIAPLVIKAAEYGDEVCKNILDEESDELLLHIKAMQKLINQPVLHVALIGSLITTNNYYSKLFQSKVKNQITNVVIQKAEMEPELGAALMAKRFYTSHTA